MYEKVFTIDFVDPSKSTISLGSSTINGPSGVARLTDLDLLGMGHNLWGEAILESLIHILENFACPEDVHAITAVNAATQTITVSGDLRKSFPQSDVFEISGSDVNNGFWTVTSSSYNTGLNVTYVVVAGTLLSSVTLGFAGHSGQPHRSLKFSPVKPLEGQVWYNQSQGQTFVFTKAGSPAGYWKRVGNISVGSTAPTAPSNGDFWWETTAYATSSAEYGRNLRVYVNGSWVRVSADYMPRDGSKNMTGNLNLGGFKIEFVANPDSADDAVNLSFADGRYVKIAGDTMTGNLNMGAHTITGVGSPISSSDAVNLGAADSRYVNITGDTMTGSLLIGGALTVETSIAAKTTVDVGQPGGSNSVVRFYDNDSVAWRELRWNNTTNVFEINNNDGSTGTIWNSANDGPLSGLDADTVDGLHAADIITTASSPAFGNSISLTGTYPYIDFIDTARNSAGITYGNILIQPIDTPADSSVGSSVAINLDATRMVVGASGWNSAFADQGAIFTYVRAGTDWRQLSSQVAYDAGAYDYYGSAAAMAADGTRLVVGASHWDGPTHSDQGGVYTYTWNGSTQWSNAITVLAATDAAAYDYFGSSVSLSANGNILAVGAPGRQSATGAVYIYDWSGGAWNQRTIVAGLGVGTYFGSSVSLSADGLTLVVGAYSSNTVYTFLWNGVTWSQSASPVVGTVGTNFGSSVSLSPDSLTLAIGANADASSGSASGSVFVYDWVSPSWVSRTPSVITAPDAALNDGFGGGIALANNSLLYVGAQGWEGATSNGGAVYGFDISKNSTVSLDNRQVRITEGPNTPLYVSPSTRTAYVYDEVVLTHGVRPGTATTIINKSGVVYGYGGWLMSFTVKFTGTATVTLTSTGNNLTLWATTATIYINGVATPYYVAAPRGTGASRTWDIPFNFGDTVTVYGTCEHSSGVSSTLVGKTGLAYDPAYTT